MPTNAHLPKEWAAALLLVGPNGQKQCTSQVSGSYQQGDSPESIRAQYPALSLEEVYGAITYALAHPEEVDAYLKQQGIVWTQFRDRADHGVPPVVKRLRELKQADIPVL